MTGRIPQPFIDELIARTDIVEVIGRRVPLRKAGKEFSACCPFHEEKTPSFTVSPVKQFYHCFGCGAHGTALGFLMEHEHLGFVEAVEELAALAGLEVPREAGAPGPDAALYELMERVAAYYRRELKKTARAADYLGERGLDAQTAAEFGIGFAPEGWDNVLRAFGGERSEVQQLLQVGLIAERQGDDGGRRHYDRFRNRLMFPIRDVRGRVIAFGGRVLGEAGEREPKYLNSPETLLFRKGRELYGLHEMRRALRDIPRVLVVEGYMDVVALVQHGLRYAVATLGTATTGDHLNRLFRICDEIVFCFDGDRAGRTAAWRALENALPCIQGGRQLRFLFLPEGEDPDSVVRAEGAAGIEKRLEQAEPLSEFLIRHLAEDVDLESIDGRAGLAERARPLVAKVPPGVYRQLLIDRLAELVRLPPERLAPEMTGEATPTAPAPRRRPLPRRLASGRDSLVRRAIRLVLHYPAIATSVGELPALREVELAGIDVLVALLEDARAHPHITGGGLLERWREHEMARHLSRLAASEVLVDEPQARAELGDLVTRLLRHEGPAIRVTRLLEKAHEQGLTEVEKQELQRLLGRGLAEEEAGAEVPGAGQRN